tara:strand:+ start:373 stop:840 length:468 start_codon:yes stop_codon:yes gene_type:complete
MAQAQRVRDLPDTPVEAIKYLSSCVTYRGSRSDLAEVKRDYIRYPSSFRDKAVVILGKETLNRKAKTGPWTYPGWRVDVSAALRSSSYSFGSVPLGELMGELDRKQEIHEGVPPGVFSAGWTSCESYLSLIPANIYLFFFYVFFAWSTLRLFETL